MLAQLRTSITSETLRRRASAFWGWWSSELKRLLPDGWRTALDDWRRNPVLSEVEGELVLDCSGMGAGRIILDAPDAAAAVDRCFGTVRWKPLRRHFEVQIPQRLVIFRHVTLPKAAGPRLRSALTLQIGRLSPLAAELVSFDYRIVSPETATDIAVELAIVPNAALKRYHDALLAVGLVVKIYSIPGLAYRFKDRNSSFSVRSFAWALWMAGLIQILGAVALVQSARESEMAAAVQRADSLRASASNAAALRNEVDKLLHLQQLVAQRVASPQPLDVLLELTRALPSTVRLTSLTVEGRDVRMAGLAPSVQGLIKLLRRTGHFAAIRSVLTPSQNNGPAGFFVEAQIATSMRRGGAQ
jgi:Tfp pilus assembly PilM family ATPase